MHSCTADTQPTAYVGMQKESSPEPNTASASHPNPAYAPRLCSACRGKLRASNKREDLSSTLVHSLWPVRRCLKALTLSSLIQIQILMHVCVRNSPQLRCVLPPPRVQWCCLLARENIHPPCIAAHSLRVLVVLTKLPESSRL